MTAFLKNIIYGEDNFSLFHPITLQFGQSQEWYDLYSCGSTIEQEFLNESELRDIITEGKVSDDIIEEKKLILSSLIGKEFQVNLYNISISELKNNQFEEIEVLYPYSEYDDSSKSQKISIFRIASIKSRDDEVFIRKLD